ncbi:DsbA family protein [Candidatus Laterigemmans baculatus]|uniref:DsbA family protein n=1 Tax=Candidatus Laterigemmans baculatus TaxID=2770505 RepID=UPI0013D931BB|nr:DsbA family protein [Candidatus Laterigemmans baculatus]
MPRMEMLEETRAATTGLVEIEYFTDPLCCWSWALEPQWRRLRFEFGNQLAWRYRMGGMISDWSSYDDPVNSIHRPSQMGPLWFQARELSGMPLEDRIWLEDPPESSYPGCAAFKAAELQSPQAGEAYLRLLREAAMFGRQNIARQEVLERLARQLQEEQAVAFDAERFAEDFQSPEVRTALREDLRLARYLGIGRYPSLILRRPGEERGLLLTGYRPYKSLVAAVRHVDDRTRPDRRADSVEAYQAYWGRTLDREIAELESPVA